MGVGVRRSLPFTPKGRATEIQAARVKRALGLPGSASIDPFAVLSRIPARLVDARDFVDAAPPHVRATLLGAGAGEWSAIGLGASPATGEQLIVVNSTHHVHRQRASLMEEVVHLVLGHPMTRLERGESGVFVRCAYDERVEDEAFSVGAACILPWADLFAAVSTRAESQTTIAERYGVSEAYVRYRILRAGLSRVYAARQRDAA